MSDPFKKSHYKITSKHGSNFCAAPFTSMHTVSGGTVTTCCKTRVPIGNLNENTPEEIMNSDHAKKVRAQFLRNERPAQCKNCWDYEDGNNGEPANNRVFSNHTVRDIVDKAVAGTNEDGTIVDHNPGWLDLLWTNNCNFACVGCGPELSTTIATKYKKEFAIINGMPLEDYHPNVNGEWKHDNEQLIDYVISNGDSLRMIHLNGGEPFMQEDTYKLLDQLLEKGLEKKVRIWAHTNGSILKYKGIDLVEDYLKHWGDNCKITISSDHCGERGNWIRYGYKESKWVRAYNRFIDNGINVGIQTCYNLLNALTIEDLGEWYYNNLLFNERASNDEQIYGSLTIWQGHRAYDPRLLQISPKHLDEATQQLERLLEHRIAPINWHLAIKGHINYIHKPIDDEQLKFVATNFINGTDAIDKARGTNFAKAFPELVDFREIAKQFIM